jgi:hypothetical protein
MERIAMAAQFTSISIQDMQQFLGRSFRAMHPTAHNLRGEVVIDLALNDEKTIGIRVWTSIPAGGTQGADVGTDAIRVQFFNFHGNHPLERGKAPIVKRTQNWRENLKDRIGDIMEKYQDQEEYWEARAR